MVSYVIRRLLLGLVTLFCVVFLLHLLTTLAIQLNGNPALAFFGDRVPTPSQLQAVKERYGLGDPCYNQPGNPCLGPFVDRLGEYARGDFGTDHRDREVVDLVTKAAPNTLRLFVIVTITWLIAGMFLGSVAARFRGRPIDHSIRLTSILIDAFPVFVMLVVYRFIFTVPLSTWARRTFGSDSLAALLFKPSFSTSHPWATLIIPGILLGLTGCAPFLRLVRAAQLENYNADHVRTARSKGLSNGHVTVFHIVRNSSIPVVTAVGFVFADALAGAVITEGVMNIYGMGGLLWKAVQDSDVAVVIGVVTILSMVTIGVMLLVDLAYAVLDPRIRYD
ncbi:ABC transporter permease [Microlunatus soli]|uniref:Peptide/nickel transport system permease protein n=1 Tax=Microlunatus soli TaxID=630515 RepID=A0A1H1WFL2_9ACTN|nr:ABC transporter permease [Microlunatus soli]SDS96178.1 peptide/nickel transport system permease protein [Microlunatus soli]